MAKCYLGKLLYGEMLLRQVVIWRNVTWASCYMAKCYLGELLYGEMLLSRLKAISRPQLEVKNVC